MLSSINEFSTLTQKPLPTLDENWSQWQLNWGMENVALFDKQGERIKSWGNPLTIEMSTIARALRNEIPEHQVICPDDCFQQAIVPIIDKSQTIGALSLSRSFADVIIKYRQATHSDIGILVANGADDTARKHRWSYRLSGMTTPEKNGSIFAHISERYTVAELLANSKTVEIGDAVFELRVIAVNENNMATPPFFLLIDDVTASTRNLNNILKQVWLYGLISLFASLLLLLFLLHLSLRHIARLSQALPLLSTHRYDVIIQTPP